MVTKHLELSPEYHHRRFEVYDRLNDKWISSDRKIFRRQKTIVLIDAVTFNASTTTYTGFTHEVEYWKKGLMLINLDVTGAPTDIVFDVEFSDDNSNWFKYMRGVFGDLRYEDSAGDKKECLDFPILAPYIRCKATATGTDASKTFLITIKAILNAE